MSYQQPIDRAAEADTAGSRNEAERAAEVHPEQEALPEEEDISSDDVENRLDEDPVHQHNREDAAESSGEDSA